MKVVLTIFGNHQGAGIYNFPTREAAKDFALKLVNTVKTYGGMGLILMMNVQNMGKTKQGNPTKVLP